MELSTAVHRCIWRTCIRSSNHRRYITSNNTTFISRSKHQQGTRVSSRSLSSTATNRQDKPPQPRPASQERSIHDTVGAQPPNPPPEEIPKPDPNKRIDLSALSGIPTLTGADGEATKSTRLTQTSRSSTASARLEALFNRPSNSNPDNSSRAESPFQKAIRQTDAMDRSSRPPFSPMTSSERIDIGAFLEDLQGTRPDNNPPNSVSDADAKMPLRLKPTLGRTQPLDPGRGLDLTRAFRMLEIKCATNGVKRDLARQRFHVRRGQRAKLDRSLRWREAFKAGFLAECARVRRMKNQGW